MPDGSRTGKKELPDRPEELCRQVDYCSGGDESWKSAFRRVGTALAGRLTEPFFFLGGVILALPGLFRRRGLRWQDVRYYLDLCGTQSLPIVILISVLMGAVLALQAALQMQKVGTEIFVVDLVGYAVIKEFGPLMVAMIATGRAGSAFAAEIGTMKVNEEISALATMGIRPEGYLVFPKLLAMVLAMPVLTVFGDAAGILGGMFVGVSWLEFPAAVYWERTVTALNPVSLLLGVLKSIPFSVLITLCGCYCGFTASGDAQGVGRGATRAVVLSIFYVVVADAVITMLYSFIGY